MGNKKTKKRRAERKRQKKRKLAEALNPQRKKASRSKRFLYYNRHITLQVFKCRHCEFWHLGNNIGYHYGN